LLQVTPVSVQVEAARDAEIEAVAVPSELLSRMLSVARLITLPAGMSATLNHTKPTCVPIASLPGQKLLPT